MLGHATLINQCIGDQHIKGNSVYLNYKDVFTTDIDANCYYHQSTPNGLQAMLFFINEHRLVNVM